MDNLTFGKKFNKHDNGERILFWKEGFPKYDGLYLFSLDSNEVQTLLYINGKLIKQNNEICEDTINIVAHMKLPQPFKK